MKISAKRFFRNFADFESKDIPSIEEKIFTEEQQKFLDLFSKTGIDEVNNTASFEEVLDFFNPDNFEQFNNLLQFKNEFLEQFSQFQAKLGTMEGIKLKRRRVL